MSSVLSDQWPLAAINNTPDTNSCYNNSRSTVLNGDRFGGVPLVLLLNSSLFLVHLPSYCIKCPIASNVCHSKEKEKKKRQ